MVSVAEMPGSWFGNARRSWLEGIRSSRNWRQFRPGVRIEHKDAKTQRGKDQFGRKTLSTRERGVCRSPAKGVSPLSVPPRFGQSAHEPAFEPEQLVREADHAGVGRGARAQAKDLPHTLGLRPRPSPRREA